MLLHQANLQQAQLTPPAAFLAKAVLVFVLVVQVVLVFQLFPPLREGSGSILIANSTSCTCLSLAPWMPEHAQNEVHTLCHRPQQIPQLK